MLDFIRMSVEIVSHTIHWPRLWAALGIVLAAGTLAQIRPRQAAALSPTRWICEITALVLGPLSMLVWGWYVWPPNGSYSPHEAANLRVLDCLAVASVAVAAGLVWRHRTRLWRTLFLATLSLLWASGAFETAFMAIRNTWP
ncbi:MAG TPA: hypothetical protein VFK57_07720 [Vicinamibacterales bacterium]|nr:hypothetical protein [Vicinamibacterales bacterium]